MHGFEVCEFWVLGWILGAGFAHSPEHTCKPWSVFLCRSSMLQWCVPQSRATIRVLALQYYVTVVCFCSVLLQCSVLQQYLTVVFYYSVLLQCSVLQWDVSQSWAMILVRVWFCCTLVWWSDVWHSREPQSIVLEIQCRELVVKSFFLLDRFETCNLQHTTATHHCNTPRQHTTVQHDGNRELQ